MVKALTAEQKAKAKAAREKRAAEEKSRRETILALATDIEKHGKPNDKVKAMIEQVRASYAKAERERAPRMTAQELEAALTAQLKALGAAKTPEDKSAISKQIANLSRRLTEATKPAEAAPPAAAK